MPQEIKALHCYLNYAHAHLPKKQMLHLNGWYVCVRSCALSEWKVLNSLLHMLHTCLAPVFCLCMSSCIFRAFPHGKLLPHSPHVYLLLLYSLSTYIYLFIYIYKQCMQYWWVRVYKGSTWLFPLRFIGSFLGKEPAWC